MDYRWLGGGFPTIVLKGRALPLLCRCRAVAVPLLSLLLFLLLQPLLPAVAVVAAAVTDPAVAVAAAAPASMMCPPRPLSVLPQSMTWIRERAVQTAVVAKEPLYLPKTRVVRP